jgi:small subunit ribosomal protein S15
MRGIALDFAPHAHAGNLSSVQREVELPCIKPEAIVAVTNKESHQMALTPEVKKEIIAKYGTSATDTGSPEAQVALLSKRIEDITTHLKTNPHDHHNRRGLLMLVGQRRRILQYLAKTDIARYRAIIEKLGIRR